MTLSWPARFCLEPGCGERVVKGRCPEHTRAYNRQRNADHARSLYHEARWRRERARFLRQPGHELCVWCQAEGRTTAAECVDHEPAHNGDRDKFYDRSTWRASCTPCNSRRANWARRVAKGRR